MFRVLTTMLTLWPGAVMTPLLAAVSLQVGQPAPSMPLPAVEDGKTLSLADFRGKRTVLHVFASW